MFIERRINQSNDTVELWRCEWENRQGSAAKKVYLQKIGGEQPQAQVATATFDEEQASCWSYGRTLGNIAVFSPSLLGRFPGKAGDDAQLPCDFVHAGKFRHGAGRWWCRTHQTHWGTKADQESFDRLGEIRCAKRIVFRCFVSRNSDCCCLFMLSVLQEAYRQAALNGRGPNTNDWKKTHDGDRRLSEGCSNEEVWEYCSAIGTPEGTISAPGLQADLPPYNTQITHRDAEHNPYGRVTPLHAFRTMYERQIHTSWDRVRMESAQSGVEPQGPRNRL